MKFGRSSMLLRGALVFALAVSAASSAESRGIFARLFGLGHGRGGQAAQQQQVSVPGLQSYTISVGGQQREYFLHVPASLPAGQKVPLIIGLHGGGGTAEGFAATTGMVSAADKDRFILALPQGLRHSWNTGGVPRMGYASRTGVNDDAFITAMINQILAKYPVDPKKVHATGMSAGGMMAYRLACDMPQRFSSIAVVSGDLVEPQCSGLTGVSLLHIHGTNDQNVPLAGGRGALSGRKADYPPVINGIDLVKTRNQCTAAPAQSKPAQDTSCQTWSCGDGATVEFCKVANGGHAWPGSSPKQWQQKYNVYVSPYFNATNYVTSFLLSH